VNCMEMSENVDFVIILSNVFVLVRIVWK